jgi:hypothetical protein
VRVIREGKIMTKVDLLGKLAQVERERDAWKREAERQADEIEAMRRKAVRSFTRRELADSQYPG